MFIAEKTFKHLGARILVTTNKFLAPRRFSNLSTPEKSIFCSQALIAESKAFNSFTEERGGLNFIGGYIWKEDHPL